MFCVFSRWIAFLTLGGLLFVQAVEAHPVSYAGSFMIESNNDPSMTENNVIYSPTRRMSLGVQNFHFHDVLSQNALYPRIGLLLHRWNLDDWQINLYAWSGVGWIRQSDNDEFGFYGAGQFDAESRRFYFASQIQTLQQQELKDIWMSRTGLGVAPYLANSNELHSFLVLQVFYNSYNNDAWMIGPMVRMFYKTVFLEVGSGYKGEWMINFMTSF